MTNNNQKLNNTETRKSQIKTLNIDLLVYFPRQSKTQPKRKQ